MFAYKTNSAQYLDYVASVLSRQQIQADPDLCLLLENEYIKDNMEMAIRWNEAKYGDYQAKYDFVEYFMCNGPELDADTILHYRAKAFTDPTIMEIAYSYFPNTGVISDIRRTKYGKETDDCFQNPCFYLGRFSGLMGHLGDVENTYGAFSWLANTLRGKGLQQKQAAAIANKQATNGLISKEEAKARADAAAKSALQASSDTTAPVGSKQVIAPSTPVEVNVLDEEVPAMGTYAFMCAIPETFQKGWNLWWKSVTDGTTDFTDEILLSTNGVMNADKLGDWASSKFGKMFELIAKANVRRQMGDCGRLWSLVRNLNLFSANNSFGPISPSQMVGDTYPNGLKANEIKNPSPSAKDANPDIAAADTALKEMTPPIEVNVIEK